MGIVGALLITRWSFGLLIDTGKKRADLIKKLSGQQEFCFDTETTGIDPLIAEPVGLSFSIKKGSAWYVPIPEKKKEAAAILVEFRTVFENPDIRKIGQNIKYDYLVLKSYGIDVKGRFFDTMIAHYLLEPESRHNMDILAENYLNYRPISIETLIGEKGKKQGSMRDVEVEKVVAQFFFVDAIWGLAIVLCQLPHGAHIVLLGLFGQAPQLHVLDHSLP